MPQCTPTQHNNKKLIYPPQNRSYMNWQRRREVLLWKIYKLKTEKQVINAFLNCGILERSKNVYREI
jgi:hypothetical protein